MLPEGTYVSEWLKYEELIAIDCLERGDVIEFYRLVKDGRREYKHWAIYCGTKVDQNGQEEAQIIHYSTVEGDFGSDGYPVDEKTIKQKKRSFLESLKFFRSGRIMKSNLKAVAGEDLIRVNNDMDRTQKPYDSEMILERAEKKLKRAEELGKGDYHLLVNNCEHFVRFCRYGNRASLVREIDGLCETIGALSYIVWCVTTPLGMFPLGKLIVVFLPLWLVNIFVAIVYISFGSYLRTGIYLIVNHISVILCGALFFGWIPSIVPVSPPIFLAADICIRFLVNVWFLYYPLVYPDGTFVPS